MAEPVVIMLPASSDGSGARTYATSVGGGAITVADGADVALGAVADAVVAAGATGTVSAKLRRLTTDLSALLAASVAGGAVVAQDDLILCQSANSTTTGTTFAALAQTTTLPAASSSRCIITLAGRENLALILFGRNSNNLTLKFRVSGWRVIGGEYIATTICEGTGTLSSSLTGRSGGTPSNSDLYCDTLTVDKGIGVVLASPADDTGIASVEVPVGNYDLAEVQFIRNGSATEVNGLYQTY